MSGVETLNRVIWRDGNRQQINIWCDPRLPRDVTRRPIMPRHRNLLTKVEELIDHITAQWDVQLLQQPFGRKMSKLSGQCRCMEKWKMWSGGTMTVRVVSLLNKLTGYIEQLWKVDCTPKVKHFLWRLSHNTLALRKVLHQRGMKLDMRCCMCGRFDEDSCHLLFKCKEVRRIWRELNIEHVRHQLASTGSVREMMEMVLSLKGKEQITVIMLLWLWWGE